ncbi:MAG TPA: hypothetical protein VL979_12270 [Solirubrobacteraceae bacterium]|nr:hypothetical protein [Solirubrobacteraceae bacterium]
MAFIAWVRILLRLLRVVRVGRSHHVASVQAGSDFVWFFFLVLMRPWAMILVKTLEPAD